MIKIENLYKNYGNNSVFEDFSLTLEKAKITCILGESGSGKTTLLNVLAGFTEYIGNVDKVKCSYVFQKPCLINNLTVKDNLLLVNSNGNSVKAMLEEMQIEDKLDAYPKHLSGGQAQRVSLARALLYEAQLYLMDEPFVNLDLRLKYSIIDFIKNLVHKNGYTMLMVTHDVKEAVSIADRIVIIRNGKIQYDIEDINEKTESEIFGLMLKN
ncbi:MAG: ATP-binding cassette domain-containing protein [Clostridia bacterium]|nr:ATP-binding cassette domain-containing protein [Clostridia bacterium]